MFELVFRSSRFSFYLSLLRSVPIALEAPMLISLWLGQLPDHVVSFVRLIVIITAIDATAFPINASSTATGNIKLYQTVDGVISMLNLPVAYVSLLMGGAPEVVFIISLCLTILSFSSKLWAINKVIDFPIKDYLREVCCKVLMVGICALLVPLIVHIVWRQGLISSFTNCIVSVITTFFVVFSIGMSEAERHSISDIISNRINRDRFFAR